MPSRTNSSAKPYSLELESWAQIKRTITHTTSHSDWLLLYICTWREYEKPSRAWNSPPPLCSPRVNISHRSHKVFPGPSLTKRKTHRSQFKPQSYKYISYILHLLYLSTYYLLLISWISLNKPHVSTTEASKHSSLDTINWASTHWRNPSKCWNACWSHRPSNERMILLFNLTLPTIFLLSNYQSTSSNNEDRVYSTKRFLFRKLRK